MDKNVKIKLRPPIVTIMGHVDHGKTTLLDKIRQSKLTSREAGGITQTIGAYQIEINVENQPEKITFIDTPGHAAFSQMRARGAKITDLAILVIAADEGVKAQTKECLQHIKAAKIPFIVAINKIDLSTANAEKVKGELAELGFAPESYGGKLPTVDISAKTGQGIKDLLELIVLMGKMLELAVDPQADFRGVVLESKKDARRGAVATVIVKSGYLRPRQTVYLGAAPTKIRALFSELGRPVDVAEPGQPVEVMGFSQPPLAGSLLTSQPTAESGGEKAPVSFSKQSLAKKADILALLANSPDEKEVEHLKIILRADSQGSLEAAQRNLPPEVEIISAGVGEINEADIFLAQTSGAQIYGFRTGINSAARKEAQQHQVFWRTFAIIYELFETVEKEMRRLEEPALEMKILGKAEILQSFPFNGKKVAGCRVVEGKLNKQWRVHLLRQGKDLGEARIASLRRGKQPADEVLAGNECGLILSPQLDFQPGDMLLSYSNKKSD